MSINKKDVSQDIASAVTATFLPIDLKSTKPLNEEEGTSLGEAPLHLRHLFNLLAVKEQEASAAKKRDLALWADVEAVKNVLTQSLKQRYQLDTSKYMGYTLCKGGQLQAVYGDVHTLTIHIVLG